MSPCVQVAGQATVSSTNLATNVARRMRTSILWTRQPQSILAASQEASKLCMRSTTEAVWAYSACSAVSLSEATHTARWVLPNLATMASAEAMAAWVSCSVWALVIVFSRLGWVGLGWVGLDSLVTYPGR